MQTTIAPTTTASEIEARLRQVGFTDGPPAHCRADAAKDAAAYKFWPCSDCGKRTCTFKPFRRGIVYRALLVCRRCGHGEEV